MKPSISLVLSSFLLAVTLTAQEARKLEEAELDASFSKQATPLKRAGGTLPGAKAGRTLGKPAPGAIEMKRTYSRSARVIIYEDGQKSEAPYAEIPILFIKGKAELVQDANTLANVALLAEKVKQYGADGGRFVIEGHASAEGDGAANQTLSEARAKALHLLLTDKHGVPGQYLLRSEGRGSRDAQAPATASEKELAQDRKVLAVKEE